MTLYKLHLFSSSRLRTSSMYLGDSVSCLRNGGSGNGGSGGGGIGGRVEAGMEICGGAGGSRKTDTG